MAFVLIVQQPLMFKGVQYVPGDRIVAEWHESAPLQRQKLTILAPPDEQRADGASQRTLSADLSESVQGYERLHRSRRKAAE